MTFFFFFLLLVLTWCTEHSRADHSDHTQNLHDETPAMYHLNHSQWLPVIFTFTGDVEGLIDDTVEEEREEEEEESGGEQGVGEEESGDEIKKKRKRSKY